ncbi:MAG: hypothetical protein GC206_13240 [Alphaproteobacteria bacterium]|nr:hypothetical protein [Alphaproteobacteria bacterium]
MKTGDGPFVLQADAAENAAAARACVGLFLDDMAEALSLSFLNEPLSYKLLALKVLIEDASDLDHHATLSYVSAVLDGVNAPTATTAARQAQAIALLARSQRRRAQ